MFASYGVHLSCWAIKLHHQLSSTKAGATNVFLIFFPSKTSDILTKRLIFLMELLMQNVLNFSLFSSRKGKTLATNHQKLLILVFIFTAAKALNKSIAFLGLRGKTCIRFQRVKRQKILSQNYYCKQLSKHTLYPASTQGWVEATFFTAKVI